ncbi:MAG: hypothetical protein GYA17_11280 [Chloroflexi bacterium]|nr:hypothetical protein [Chloroflexota bacterium]
MQAFSRFLDHVSEFLAPRKGLLPLIGMGLVLFNFLLRLGGMTGWVVNTDLFLHLGVILAILGIMLAWAL